MPTYSLVTSALDHDLAGDDDDIRRRTEIGFTLPKLLASRFLVSAGKR